MTGLRILSGVRRSTTRILHGAAGCLILAGLAMGGCGPVDDDPPLEAPHNSFADGGADATHLVPGLYVTEVPAGTPPAGCYYEVFTDWTRDVRRTNGFGTGGDQLSIHILPDDKIVNSTGCGRWTLSPDPT